MGQGIQLPLRHRGYNSRGERLPTRAARNLRQGRNERSPARRLGVALSQSAICPASQHSKITLSMQATAHDA
eukprot:359491-Chlamydomonas_euryale.AAC.10